MKPTWKKIAAVLILLALIILATWAFDQFVRPLLPESIDSTLVWMLTVILPAAGVTITILKDTLELTSKISGKTADKPLNLTTVQRERYREDILLQSDYWS